MASRETIVKTSITNVVEAVTSVVSRSTNNEFRETCFALLKVPNSACLSRVLSEELKLIAQRQLVTTWSEETEHETETLSPSSELSQQPDLSNTESLLPGNRVLTSSQCVDTNTSLQHSSLERVEDNNEHDDDFIEFCPSGFNDVMTGLASSPPTADSNHTASPGPVNTKSHQMIDSACDEDDWCDDVLDSDLFLNES